MALGIWFLQNFLQQQNNSMREEKMAKVENRRLVANSLFISVISITAVLLIWASFSKLDVVSRAHGVLIPSSKTQVIQSPDGGVIEKILVKEGDIVEKGTLLVKLDKVRANAVYQESFVKKVALETSIARLRAEVEGTDFVLPDSVSSYPDIGQAETEFYKKRKESLENELETLRKSLDLTRRELSISEPLLKSGEVSEVDVLRLRRQVNDMEGAIAQRKNKFINDTQADLVKAEGDLTAQKEVLESRENLLKQTDIYSPIKGVVKNVKFTTEGGVIKAAEDIMQIVPVDDELMLEVKINPVDIAYLHEGQDAFVRFDAFSYTNLDHLEGKLTYISPDTLKDDTTAGEVRYYKGYVKIESAQIDQNERDIYLKKIVPGMSASIDVKIGQRSVLDYLLRPITRGVSESMNER